MTRLDQKKDPDWRGRFLAPVFGVVFLALGVLGFLQRRVESIGYWYVGLGLVWLVKGIVHASRWQKKKRAFERALHDCFE